MSFVSIVKKVALDAVRASDPVAVMTGTVTKVNPLEVFVDQRFTLSEDFLIVPEQLALRGLKSGDKLIILRVQGGQQFLLFDKVVSQ